MHLYLILVLIDNDQLRISGCKCKKNIKINSEIKLSKRLVKL